MLTKSSTVLCVQRLSLKTENRGFIFCSHEPWLEPRELGINPEESRQSLLKMNLLGFTLSVAFGLVPVHTLLQWQWGGGEGISEWMAPACAPLEQAD